MSSVESTVNSSEFQKTSVSVTINTAAPDSAKYPLSEELVADRGEAEKPLKTILKQTSNLALSKESAISKQKMVYFEDEYDFVPKDVIERFRDYMAYVILSSNIEGIKTTATRPGFHLYLSDENKLCILVVHAKGVNETICIREMVHTEEQKKLMDKVTEKVIAKTKELSVEGVQTKQVGLNRYTLYLIGMHCKHGAIPKDQKILSLILISESKNLECFSKDFFPEESIIPIFRSDMEFYSDSDLYVVCFSRNPSDKVVGKIKSNVKDAKIVWIQELPNRKENFSHYYYAKMVIDQIRDIYTISSEDPKMTALKEMLANRAKLNALSQRGKQAIFSDLTKAYTVLNRGVKEGLKYAEMELCLMTPAVEKDKIKAEENKLYVHPLMDKYVVRQSEELLTGTLPYRKQYGKLVDDRSDDLALKNSVVGSTSKINNFILEIEILGVALRKEHITFPQYWYTVSRAINSMMIWLKKYPKIRWELMLNEATMNGLELKQLELTQLKFLKSFSTELVMNFNSAGYWHVEIMSESKPLQIIPLSTSAILKHSVNRCFFEKDIANLSVLGQEIAAVYIIFLSEVTSAEHLSEIQNYLDNGLKIIQITAERGKDFEHYAPTIIDEIVKIYDLPEIDDKIIELKSLLSNRAKKILSSKDPKQEKKTILPDLIEAYVTINAHPGQSLRYFERYKTALKEIDEQYKYEISGAKRNYFDDKKILIEKTNAIEAWVSAEKEWALESLLEMIKKHCFIHYKSCYNQFNHNMLLEAEVEKKQKETLDALAPLMAQTLVLPNQLTESFPSVYAAGKALQENIGTALSEGALTTIEATTIFEVANNKYGGLNRPFEAKQMYDCDKDVISAASNESNIQLLMKKLSSRGVTGDKIIKYFNLFSDVIEALKSEMRNEDSDKRGIKEHIDEISNNIERMEMNESSQSVLRGNYAFLSNVMGSPESNSLEQNPELRSDSSLMVSQFRSLGV